MNILLIGPQGSGKGTQGELLSQSLQIPHISSGDLLREEMTKHTPRARKLKTLVNNGKLVPDVLIEDMVLDRLGKVDCRKGFILEGFPRTIAQAEWLGDARTIRAVIELRLSTRDALRRIFLRKQCVSCGHTFGPGAVAYKKGSCDHCGGKLEKRADDTPAAVKKRLALYHEKTEPLIAYYRKQKVLLSFDGAQEIQGLFGKIANALKKIN